MLDLDIRHLEEIGARAWPAQRMERLGDWLLSIDRGLTRRANSVQPNGDCGMGSVGEAIADVERRYRDHGLDPRFKVTRAAQPQDLDEILDRQGYRSEGHSLVLIRAHDIGEEPPRLDVELASEPTPEWIHCSWPDAKGNDPRVEIAQRISGQKAFALVRVDTKPAGAALGVIEQGWGCVTAVHALPDFRRRGVARSSLAALARWARLEDAPSLFLQVDADNGPALGLYMSMGFRPAYRYHYRTLDR